MGGDLKERFEVNVYGVAASVVEYSSTNNSATLISGAAVDILPLPQPTLYRVTLGGKMSGANGAKTIGINIGGTNVISIASDGNDGADWMAHFIITIINSKNQKCIGKFVVESAESSADYAAGTVDLTNGAVMTPYILAAHESDTIYCEVCTVEQGLP